MTNESVPSRSPDVHGWLDIATAPRDGTWILVFLKTDHPQETVCWAHDAWANGYNDQPVIATHWQPLPAPPVQS